MNHLTPDQVMETLGQRTTSPAENLARLTVAMLDHGEAIRKLNPASPQAHAADKEHIAIHQEWERAMKHYRSAPRESSPRLKSMPPAERWQYAAYERFLDLYGHDLCAALLCGDTVEIERLTKRLAYGLPAEHDGACACCGDEHG